MPLHTKRWPKSWDCMQPVSRDDGLHVLLLGMVCEPPPSLLAEQPQRHEDLHALMDHPCDSQHILLFDSLPHLCTSYKLTLSYHFVLVIHSIAPVLFMTNHTEDFVSINKAWRDSIRMCRKALA